MRMISYYEFFADSIKSFLKEWGEGVLLLPPEMAAADIYLDGFCRRRQYVCTTAELLRSLAVPHRFTAAGTKTAAEIMVNFPQQPGAGKDRPESAFTKPGLRGSEMPWQPEAPDLSPMAGSFHERDGIRYLVSKKDGGKPDIVLFNAWNVDFDIWKPLYNGLAKSCNILLFSGNYGDLSQSLVQVYQILRHEGIQDAVALTWCSGFRVFANFQQHHPRYFKKVVSLTGNYNHIQGQGKLSDFEKSLLTIGKLMDGSQSYQLDKIFSHFISRQGKKAFGIPGEVFPIVMKQFSDNNNLNGYLKIVKELSECDLESSLKQLSIPMVNVIASNDTVSAYENNQLIDAMVPHCRHVMMNFATHWCLWTHASQIAALVYREMEEYLE